MAFDASEPFFLKFQRELSQHEKSALSNPAQLLKLLTGQEHLHHPFILVQESHSRSKPRGGASHEYCDGYPNSVSSAVSSKTIEMRARLDAARADRAERKGEDALVDSKNLIFSKLAELSRQANPQAAEQLLLDLVVGTGRLFDDLRSVSNLRRALTTPQTQLKGLLKVATNVEHAIRGMQPLDFHISSDELQTLRKLLQLESQRVPQRGQDGIDSVIRKFMKSSAETNPDLRGRPIIGIFSRSRLSLVVALHSVSRVDDDDVAAILSRLGDADKYILRLGPRSKRAYTASELFTLSGYLLVIVDVALGSEYVPCPDWADSMQLLSHLHDYARAQLLVIDQDKDLSKSSPRLPGQISTCARGDDHFALQLRSFGVHMRPPHRLKDSRVPWTLDPWQKRLLDCVDGGCGAFVSAPTSAGKTFASYYAMEKVLRTSNTAAVLFVAPSAALAAQVEAEVLARFGRKPYPHDGFILCASLVPGRSRREAKKAQVIVAVAEAIEEVMHDEELWARLRWAICDEIQMVPVQRVKALATKCGEKGVPFMGMSATVRDPDKMRERLASATKCPGYRLVTCSERAVDLHTIWWDSSEEELKPVHPLLRQSSDKLQKVEVPRLAPNEALELWEALRVKNPEMAASLQPRTWFLQARLGPLAKTLPTRFTQSIVQMDLICKFLGRFQGMMTRPDFRQWERRLTSSLRELQGPALLELYSQLEESHLPKSANSSSSSSTSCDVTPPALLRVLQKLRTADMLPCVCFHLDAERIQVLLLGLASESRRQQTQDNLDNFRDVDLIERRAEARQQWQSRRRALLENLKAAQDEARGLNDQDRNHVLYAVAHDAKIWKQAIRTMNEAVAYSPWTLVSVSSERIFQLIAVELTEGGGTLIAVGGDNRIYKRNINDGPEQPWEGPYGKEKALLSIAIHDRFIYGVGDDRRVYKQSLVAALFMQEWEVACKGEIVAIAFEDGGADTMYAVMADGDIRSQGISTMSELSEWEDFCCHSEDITSIAICDDVMYAIGADGELLRQTLSKMSRTSQWGMASAQHFKSVAVPFESIRSMADVWGESRLDEQRRTRLHAGRVEGNTHVRAAKAALAALDEVGPPEVECETLGPDFDFTAQRPKRVYGTEIRMLLQYAETGIHQLAKRRNMQWEQAVVGALHQGIAMHFTDVGAEGINLVVQLLFRLGHVRVLLADEALACGMNLPCRAAVILDSRIQGSQLTQMAGRAGRRGLDLFGATVFVQDFDTLRSMHNS